MTWYMGFASTINSVAGDFVKWNNICLEQKQLSRVIPYIVSQFSGF
jgi:hypothetical protein